MDQTFTCVLLLLSLSASFGKYFFINEGKNWHDAQNYCRQTHTDLAPVSNIHDMDQLQQIVGNVDKYWIGLKRNVTDRNKWTWSGGGGVSTFFWQVNQPNNNYGEDYGYVKGTRWHDISLNHIMTFVCYSVVVVREEKTWEDALEYCREHHRNLTSVASETEMLLIQKEIAKYKTTDHVWVGLRFFSGNWLWVDKQPWNYEAWGQSGKPVCPDVKQRCVAVGGTGVVHTDNTGSLGVNTAVDNVINGLGGSGGAASVKERVWETHDCEEKLHFICS